MCEKNIFFAFSLPHMTTKEAKDIIKRILNLIKLDQRESIQIVGFAFLISIINLSLPLGIQSIINLIQSGRINNLWIILVVIVTIGAALVGIMQAIQLRITENIQQKIYARSAFDFAYRIPNFKISALTNKYTPELVNRFFDTLNLQKGLAKLLVDISTAVLQITFALILLSLYHPFFLLFSVLLVGILFIIFKLSGIKGMESSLMESKYKYKTAQWLEDIARTILTFKLAGKTDIHLTKTDTLTTSYINYREKHFRVLIFQYLNLVGFKVIVVSGLLVIGGLLVIERKINLGQFVASEIIILLIMSNMEKLITSIETAYDVLTAGEKIGQITDIELENYEDEDAFININTNDGFSVQLNKVSYQYATKEGYIIENLNLNIQKKEKVCISGFSSSGKSTIMKLLSGIYQPTEGEIKVNNHDIATMCNPELRSLIGYCFHNESLFNGTIFENITLGKENVGYQEVKWAVEHVGLKDLIKSLPDGYETEVSAQGKEFSRNTIQKILIARSIVCKPQLLLLEYSFEYFSLDTKKAILDFLCLQDQSWTMIAATNDPIIAQACDRIILLKDGEINLEGTFEELIKIPEVKTLYDA